MKGMKHVCLLVSFGALAFGGIIPQSGFSGRPGDGTCRDCHPVKTLVPRDSSVILGLPGKLQPETTYACTLVIRYKGLNEWAFEMTTVDSFSNQAGFITRADSIHTQVDTLDGVLYFKNTLRGAYIGKPDSARWTFSYTAPESGTGPVSLYWCAYIKNRKESSKYCIIENYLTVPLAESE
jgi:hypothetical protein